MTSTQQHLFTFILPSCLHGHGLPHHCLMRLALHDLDLQDFLINTKLDDPIPPSLPDSELVVYVEEKRNAPMFI